MNSKTVLHHNQTHTRTVSLQQTAVTIAVVIQFVSLLQILLTSYPDALSSSEYEEDLEEVIKDETSGDFTTALLAMLRANKDESSEIDEGQARKDAKV